MLTMPHTVRNYRLDTGRFDAHRDSEELIKHDHEAEVWQDFDQVILVRIVRKKH